MNRRFKVYKGAHARLKELGQSGKLTNVMLEALVLGRTEEPERLAPLQAAGLLTASAEGWQTTDDKLAALAARERLAPAASRASPVADQDRGVHGAWTSRKALVRYVRRSGVENPGRVANFLIETFIDQAGWATLAGAVRAGICREGGFNELARTLREAGLVAFNLAGERPNLWSPSRTLSKHLDAVARGPTPERLRDRLSEALSAKAEAEAAAEALKARNADLEERLSRLEAELAEKSDRSEVESLKDRIGKLESDVGTLKEIVGDAWTATEARDYGPEIFTDRGRLAARVRIVAEERNKRRAHVRRLEERLVKTHNDFLWCAQVEKELG